MAERSKAAVLKTAVGLYLPRVRSPFSPPFFLTFVIFIFTIRRFYLFNPYVNLFFLEPIAIQAHKETTKKQYHKSIEQYAKFIIDPVKPIIEDNSNKPIQLSFEDIIKENPIRPIKHRTELEYTDVCPYCGAPNEYIYDNNHRGQFMCKACKHTFTMHPHYHDEISIRCPHCGYKLFLHRHQYHHQNHLVLLFYLHLD